MYKNFIQDSYEVITVGFSKMHLQCKCDGIIYNTNTNTTTKQYKP